MAKIIQLAGTDNFDKAKRFLLETKELSSDDEKINNVIDYLFSITELLQLNEKVSKATVSALEESLTAMQHLSDRIKDKG